MDYTSKMLAELQILENLSEEYNQELLFLSKRIRRDIWDSENTRKLYAVIHAINLVFKTLTDLTSFFDLSCIDEYIILLAKYGMLFAPHLDAAYYNELIDDVQIENARILIDKGWKDINSSDDSLKTFKEIFSDVFENCLSKNKNKFFYELSDSDVLCRVVGNDNPPFDKDRFIPWPSKTNNRWNPPGKAYLYLSYSPKEEKYSDKLSVNEYVCLEEYRAEKGKKYHFCNFRPKKPGMILDLSYNDVSLRQIKNIVELHQNDVATKIFDEIMNDPKAIEKYKNNKRGLTKKIRSLQNKHPIEKRIVEESFAKQYLKMVCSCIYKKVDETDELKREQAYKSFQTLALYLEEQGVTGIIYPCTRTKKIIGKNIVLFNVNDAEPIEESIRDFVYE